jgi:hypothetical protein
VAQQRRLVVGEVEHERVLEPERGAQLRRQARVEAAARQADLDAHHPRIARALEQPGDAEPADTQPVRDVDLGDALEVELPRHPRGQDHLGRAVCRQAGHVPLQPRSNRSFERTDLIFAAFLDFA